MDRRADHGAKGAALIVGSVLGSVYGGGSAAKGLLYARRRWRRLLLPAGPAHLQPRRSSVRRRRRKGLADALDMLTVCVEAGQGFDAALLQVARNVEGPISGEFARVLSEIQIGKSRGEAFSGHG